MLERRLRFGELCVVAAALAASGRMAQGASATWVARPAAAAAVAWEPPTYAGRDFWMLLNLKWHELPGIRDEAFVRESGVPYVRLPLIREGFIYPVHIGDTGFDVMKMDIAIDDDVMHFGAFANDLPVDLTFRRNINDHVAGNAGLTTKPAAI